MGKGRMEAFSDGVIAILITIMVLELNPPEGTSFASLYGLAPKIGCYALSFVFIAIYWNNHHHLLQAVKHVNGAILWANAHLLFWLSLIPFVTDWMGEHDFAAVPVACYGVVLICCGIAYYILVRHLLAAHPSDSALAQAVGNDVKGRLSVVIYAVAIGLAFVRPWMACALYVCVALMWFVPDRRIERVLHD
jgi:uncharacterized membrane protein